MAFHRQHIADFEKHLAALGHPAEAAVCRTLEAAAERIEAAVTLVIRAEYQHAVSERDLIYAQLSRLGAHIMDLPAVGPRLRA